MHLLKNALHLGFFLLCTQLVACGFALQGTSLAELPPQLQTLHLETGNSELDRVLRRTLLNSKVNLLDQPAVDVYSLRLEAEQNLERIISVGADARAGEYELELSTLFSLSRDSELVFGPQRAVLQQVYFADPYNPAAKRTEAELILSEMRQQLAFQIIERLQALNL